MRRLASIRWLHTPRVVWRYLKSRYLQSPERAARLLVPLLGALPVAALFDAAGAVKQVEEPIVRLVARGKVPASSRLAVVRIGDDDFKLMFHSRRPLDPKVVRQIVDSIAALKPDAIAVDLDTSDAAYRPLANVSWAVPVVWARRSSYAQRERRFYSEDVLGGADIPNSAVVELNADDDGVVRRYRRSLATDHGDLPLLPVALLKAGGTPDLRKDPERLIDYYGHTWGGHRLHFWAGEAVKAAAEQDIVDAAPLKGKIALLGVEYHGIDEHQTPLGWMSGVEILAHIAETHQTNVRPTTRTVLSAIILCGAFLIAVGFAKMRAWRAIPVAVGGIAIGALLVWIYTRSIADMLLFAAVLVAVLFQQIYSKAKEVIKKATAPEGELVSH